MIHVLVRAKPDRANLLLYYVDDTGREVSRSAGTADRREAERAAAMWEQELLEKRGTDGTRWEFFRQRFEDEHLAGLPLKTRKCYATALNKFRALVKIDLVSAIDNGTVSRFRASLLAEGNSINTTRSYMAHMRAVFNWAAKVHIIHEAPQFLLPKLGKRKLTRGRPVTEGEWQAMRAKATPDIARLLDLLWLSGLRLEEARLLSWDSPPIYVSLDAQPHPQIVFYGEAQKSGQDDAVPIPPDLAAWLSQTPPEARTGLVAPTSGTKVGRVISALGEAAGAFVNDKDKPASAHDFRRAFGTRWAMKVRPLTLKKMMRHESLETTMRFYIGLTGADAGAELWGRKDGQD
jgi:integrase